MRWINLIIGFAISIGVIAQEEFSFKMYFKDGIGNRDTITIGYDGTATDSIDLQFGEINILSQQWDSIFEVRFCNDSYPFLMDTSYLEWESKKAINPIGQVMHQGVLFNYWSAHYILIKCKNLPLTITWDQSLIYSNGLEESSFYYPHIADYGEHLQDFDSLYFDQFDFRLQPDPNYDSIFPVMFVFQDTLTGMNIDLKEENSVLDIFPNPTSNQLSFKVDQLINCIEIYNISGQLVLTRSGDLRSIDVSDLSEGIYSCLVRFENGGVAKRIIIVQR